MIGNLQEERVIISASWLIFFWLLEDFATDCTDGLVFMWHFSGVIDHSTCSDTASHIHTLFFLCFLLCTQMPVLGAHLDLISWHVDYSFWGLEPLNIWILSRKIGVPEPVLPLLLKSGYIMMYVLLMCPCMCQWGLIGIRCFLTALGNVNNACLVTEGQMQG